MDVEKKLGMSLDDLIKKTRKDVPKNNRGPQKGPSKNLKTRESKFGNKDRLGYVVCICIYM